MTGELELTSGKIVRSRGLKLGYVPQETPTASAASPCARCWRAFSGQRDGSETGASTSCSTVPIAPQLAEPLGEPPAAGSVSFLIAGAAPPRRAGPADPRRADQLSRPRQHQHAGRLAGGQLPAAAALVVSHDRSSWSATRSTIFLRGDARTFNAGFVEARQLLQRDAADAAKARAGGKGDRAAGAD